MRSLYDFAERRLNGRVLQETEVRVPLEEQIACLTRKSSGNLANNIATLPPPAP